MIHIWHLIDCCDISVTNLIAINNSSTAKIGTETMGSKMERIHFNKICAVRTVRLAVIDAYDHTAISDVSWTDCHVHDLPATWHEPFLVDLRAPPKGMAFREIPAKARARGISLTNISADCPARARLWNRINEDGQEAIADITYEGLSSQGVSLELERDEIEAAAASS